MTRTPSSASPCVSASGSPESWRSFPGSSSRRLSSGPAGSLRPCRRCRRARWAAVEHLKGFAAKGWIGFDELAESLRQQAPGFLFEPEKLGVGVLRDAYRGIYERTPDGRALTVPPGARWRLVEERLWARLLLGPLLALGLVAVRWDRESEAPQQLQVSETLRAFVP